jgi:hypothetical protein
MRISPFVRWLLIGIAVAVAVTLVAVLLGWSPPSWFPPLVMSLVLLAGLAKPRGNGDV